MNNLTQVTVVDGKVSCERCGQPVLRDTKTGHYTGCSDHFIRMDVAAQMAIFANYDESED